MGNDAKGSIEVVRRLLATLDFRFLHVTEGAPAGFGEFEIGSAARSPLLTVRHLTDLLLFVHESFGPRPALPEAASWEEECTRFRKALRELDACLATNPELRPTRPGLDLDGLVQGPIADALTHVGQLAMLRRLAGSPVPRVRYWQVEMPLPSEGQG